MNFLSSLKKALTFSSKGKTRKQMAGRKWAKTQKRCRHRLGKKCKKCSH